MPQVIIDQALQRPKSQQAYQESCTVIPGGVNSPIRACLEMGICPIVLDYAYEDSIVDVDENHYVDYCCSWGAIIHGHAHPIVQEAIVRQISKGTSYGITSPLEAILAKKIVEAMPSVQKVRFVSSGTEATMTAARIARAYTSKSLIVKFSGNYHGHADLFLVKAGSGVAYLPGASSKGVLQGTIDATICLPYNDCEAVEKLFSKERAQDIAAVIIEPIAANMGLVTAEPQFLQLLQKKCRQVGALLIFDEVISGFRAAYGGAQELYGIEADITCLGKVIGAGFPVGAVGGKAPIMDTLAPLGHVFQAGTLSGNPVAMQAGITALELLERKGFYEELEQKACIITVPVAEYIKKHDVSAALQQVGSLFSIFFGRKSVCSQEEVSSCNRQLFKKFFHFMLKHDVYIPPSQYETWFITQAHTKEHLENTRDLIIEFLKGC